MELVLIQYHGCAKCQRGEDSCSDGCCNLFVSKDWAETSAYSWYSSRIAERSIFSEMVVDLACIVEWNWRKNVFEPERRDARSRAGALIIAM